MEDDTDREGWYRDREFSRWLDKFDKLFDVAFGSYIKGRAGVEEEEE